MSCIVASHGRPSLTCGARLRPRDGRGIGATRAVRGRMQMALACPFDVLVRREQIWACTTVATPRCAVHARVVGLRRRARFAGVCAVRRLRSICGRLAATFTCGTSSCPLAMSDCGRRVGIDEDLRALALASTLAYWHRSNEGAVAQARGSLSDCGRSAQTARAARTGARRAPRTAGTGRAMRVSSKGPRSSRYGSRAPMDRLLQIGGARESQAAGAIARGGPLPLAVLLRRSRAIRVYKQNA